MALLLTGCLFRPPDELYRRPERSAGYDQLAAAIRSVKTGLEGQFGVGCEDAVIVSGDNTASIQLQDLDGDGQRESAVAFIRVPGVEKSLKIYIFTAVDGDYQVRGLVEGDGSAIYSVDYVDLNGAGETIQFAGGTDRSRALGKLTEQVGAVDARLKRRQAVSEAVADALILVANLVMLGRALQLVAAGMIDFAAAFVAVFTFVSSFGSVMAVSRLGTSLQETLASGARVLDLLDEQPQCAEVADGQDVEFAGAAAEHVSFSYAGGVDAGGAGATEQVANDAAANLILDDVTCTFAPGTMTCIMGRSGSGKSTLLKLLMRFWDPTAGTITVSGVDARHINTASLRSHEAYMTQDTHLFCGTVRENLLVAHANATDAELLDACRSASLTTLIDRLPQGLDTPVAELGDSLSGGERQRIGLARIFLNDAPFILLDEPTSALDALNEASVMQAIDELKRRGKTIVLVSHRASTCAFADFSLSVEHGRLS